MAAMTVEFTHNGKKLLKQWAKIDRSVLTNLVFRPSVKTPMVEVMYPAVRNSVPVKTGKSRGRVKEGGASYNKTKARTKYGWKVWMRFSGATMVELGTKMRETKRPVSPWGKNRGQIQPPVKFIRKAFLQKRAGVKHSIETQAIVKLDRQMRRAGLGPLEM